MGDYKRLITIALIIIGVYTIYYFQTPIVNFITSPLDQLNQLSKEAEDGSVVTQRTENVRQVVVGEEDQVIKVVEDSNDAVVSVVRREVYFDPFSGPSETEDSIGTGFIIEGTRGIILTNRHVVSDTQATYSVVMGEGDQTFDVTDVYRDPLNDFAILKIDTGGQDLPDLPLGDSDALKVGQTVVAIGNALGEFGNSVTKGVVSGVGRGIVTSSNPFGGGGESIENVIQTDAALNPGNSGGPLLNLSGEVIGINVAATLGAENIGFSIPVNTLKPIIEGFNEEGRIVRPYLGVEIREITRDMVERGAPTVGAFVVNVVPNSPADDAGLQRGDIIIRVNGLRIDNDRNSLQRVIRSMEVGQQIDIIVERSGEEVSLRATIGDLEQ